MSRRRPEEAEEILVGFGSANLWLPGTELRPTGLAAGLYPLNYPALGIVSELSPWF